MTSAKRASVDPARILVAEPIFVVRPWNRAKMLLLPVVLALPSEASPAIGRDAVCSAGVGGEGACLVARSIIAIIEESYGTTWMQTMSLDGAYWLVDAIAPDALHPALPDSPA